MNIWLFGVGRAGGGGYGWWSITMEESGEERTVVFALIVTEPACEFVCVCLDRGLKGVAKSPLLPRSLPLACSVP